MFLRARHCEEGQRGEGITVSPPRSAWPIALATSPSRYPRLDAPDILGPNARVQHGRTLTLSYSLVKLASRVARRWPLLPSRGSPWLGSRPFLREETELQLNDLGSSKENRQIDA